MVLRLERKGATHPYRLVGGGRREESGGETKEIIDSKCMLMQDCNAAADRVIPDDHSAVVTCRRNQRRPRRSYSTQASNDVLVMLEHLEFAHGIQGGRINGIERYCGSNLVLF